MGNDNAPVFQFPGTLNHTIQVSNQVPAGYNIGSVRATDADYGENSKVTYVLAGGNENEAFYVDHETGLISTNIPLQRYETKRFELLISAMDHGTPRHTAHGVLYVHVNSSIPFGVVGETVMTPNNFMIVIIVAVVSLVVILTLIFAIVLVRSRDLRKRRERQLQYNLNIQESLQHNYEVDPTSRPINSTPIKDPRQRKDVQFADMEYGLKAHTAGMTVNDYCNQYDKAPHALPVEHPDKRNSSHKDTAPPWELSATQLQTQQQSDSDSAHSGDVSNADSGKGTSENGDPNSSNHSHNAAPVRPPPRMPISQTTIAPVLPNRRTPSYLKEYSSDKLKDNKILYDNANKDNKPPLPVRKTRLMPETPATDYRPSSFRNNDVTSNGSYV